MKVRIKEFTPDRLELVLKPNGVVYIFFALVFLASGFATLWFLGDSITLRVSEGVLSYERKFLGFHLREELEASRDEIEKVDVKIYGKMFPSYEVYLRTTDGREQKIWQPTSGGDEKRATAAELTEALKTPGGVYSGKDGIWIVGLILALTCILGGIRVLFALQVSKLSADRSMGEWVVVKKRRLSPKGERVSIPFQEFAGIEPESDVMVTPKHTVISYHVVINRKKGRDNVSLSSGPMFTETSAAEVVDLVSEWWKTAGQSPQE